MEHGVDKETIQKYWCEKNHYIRKDTAFYRDAMLGDLAKAPKELRDLCETPGNEIQIARIIRQLNWHDSAINSFIFWYHKKHNDPGCKRNNLNIGLINFSKVWWPKLIKEGEEVAEQYRKEKLYWKSYWQKS
jgi:hypothetical protein